MTKSPLRCALWSMLLLMASGCARRATVKPEAGTRDDVGRFYPLAVGNAWVYQARFLGEQRQQRVQIVKREGNFYVDNQGARLTTDAHGLRDERRYLLRGPIRAGVEWTNVISVSSTEKYRILEAQVPCAAPAGRFEGCVRVEGRNRVDERTTLVNVLTFAPGVGLVNIEVVAETAGKRIPQTELRLVSYRLEKS